MNKLAEYLNRRWPGRVVSINWGPWLKRGPVQGTGMVSPELQRQFAERGIQLIPISTGCRILDRELRYGRKEEVEVIVAGGGEWRIAKARPPDHQTTRPSDQRLPLLQSARLSTAADGGIEVTHTLDPSSDLCLRDHQLDGNPVLPTAGAIELLAEVVSQGWPGLEIVSLCDIRVLRGIVLRDGPETVRVAARPIERPQPRQGRTGPVRLNVRAEITGLGADRACPTAAHTYYSAIVELTDRLPGPPLYERRLPSNLRSFPTSIEEAYRRYLFHGPTLQCISEIEGIAERGIVATVIPSTPQQCLTGDPTGEWLIDPVVIDSGFQLAILWARVYHDFTPLPSRFRIYRRYGPLSGPAIRCYLHTHAFPDSLIMHTNLFFVSLDGRVLGAFEGAESTCSRVLNRLARQHLTGPSSIVRTRSVR